MNKKLSDFGDNALLGSALTVGWFATCASIDWVGNKISAMMDDDDESGVHHGPPKGNKRKPIKKKKKAKKA
jgi:hypothetical protein